MNWGEPISLKGLNEQPVCLQEGDRILWATEEEDRFKSFDEVGCWAGYPRGVDHWPRWTDGDWEAVRWISLPADHPAYAPKPSPVQFTEAMEELEGFGEWS